MKTSAPGEARRPSLRRRLLLGILVPVVLFIAFNTLSLYQQTLASLHTAYDRTLLASAKTISEQLDVTGYDDSAELRATVPYSALEAFEADNQSQMGAFAAAWAAPDHAKNNPAIIIVPQAPARTVNYETGDDALPASRAEPPLATILALMDRISQDPGVDPSRISVVGFSMGASAAMQAVLARPRLFSAVVAFSAVPPPRAAARRMPRIPILVVHGDKDAENPIEPDLAWATALDRASARGRMIVYDGMDHRVPDDMLTSWDWRAWVLAQRR